MARSDLIIALARAAVNGNASNARRTIEAIRNEELHKGHQHVARILDDLLRSREIPDVEESEDRGQIKAALLGPENLVSSSNPPRSLDKLEIRDEARDTILEILMEQEQSHRLRQYGLEPRNKILLTGAPGTGKTSMARAIAAELGVPLHTLQYETIIGSYLGETSARLKAVMLMAAREPCVLFLDEFDTIAKERGDTHETGEIKRVVSTLLLMIDALPTHVIVVAATNHGELLDRAAWRRFNVVIELPIPSLPERIDYAKRLADRISLNQVSDATRRISKMHEQSYAAVEELVLSLRRREILSSTTK